MKDIKRNEALTVLTSIFRALALLCATGPIMQAFLASLGFSSQYLYLHSTATQAANVVTILLCSRWADRGSIIRRAAIVQLPYALLYLGLIPLCLWRSASLSAFLILTGICLLQSVFLALYTVCEYKLPYYIYPPEDYGPLAAVCGIAGSVLSLLSGMAIAWLSGFVSYPALMLGACCLSLLMMGLCVFLTLGLKPVCQPVLAQKEQPRLPLKEVLRCPVFYRLIPANLFRGFSSGTTTVLAAVALDLGFHEGTLTALVSVQALAGLLGCAAFGIATRQVSPRKLVLAGSLCFLVLPLMLVPKEPVFFAAVTVLLIGRTFVDYAVPSALRFAVPVDIAGPYNALRMLLHNGGTLVATTLAAFLPVQWLLVLTMALQLLSGLRFCTLKEIREAT